MNTLHVGFRVLSTVRRASRVLCAQIGIFRHRKGIGCSGAAKQPRFCGQHSPTVRSRPYFRQSRRASISASHSPWRPDTCIRACGSGFDIGMRSPHAHAQVPTDCQTEQAVYHLSHHV